MSVQDILKAVDNINAEVARLEQLVSETFPTEEDKPKVDGVVVFEGMPYKRVDRLAKAGDVVVFTQLHAVATRDLTANKPYEVQARETITFFICDDGICEYMVYRRGYSRTPETVLVYERTTWEDVQRDQLFTVVPPLPTPTPNEHRAALIERAKQFVAEQHKAHMLRIGHFKSDRTVVVHHILGDGEWEEGHATIGKDEVFNLDIAKAIAVGRVLGVDVSEFENAVQPTEWVVGMGLRGTDFMGKHFYYDAITKITHDDRFGTRLWKDDSFATKNAKERVGQKCEDPIITDDTNAKY